MEETKRSVRLDGQLLYRRRKAKGWNQQKLADVVGVSKRTIESAEHYRPVLLLNAQSIAQALDIPYAELVLDPSVSSSATERQPFPDRPETLRIVAFDLDGTLILGMEYSWKLIWECLGYDDETRREGMRRYLQRKSRADGLTYAQWCAWCCQMFREKGLSPQHLKAVASRVRLTQNFYPATRALREAGCTLALISGGVDTLLYELIPDAEDVFDYISINRLVFDAAGVLDRIEPTEGDFEGKKSVLERVCLDRGASIRQTVFVGDSLNDEDIIGSTDLGLRIAYNPHSQTVVALADVVIKQDDLNLILPHILDL